MISILNVFKRRFSRKSKEPEVEPLECEAMFSLVEGGRVVYPNPNDANVSAYEMRGFVRCRKLSTATKRINEKMTLNICSEHLIGWVERLPDA